MGLGYRMQVTGEGTTWGGILEGGGGICTYPLHTPHITKGLSYTGAIHKKPYYLHGFCSKEILYINDLHAVFLLDIQAVRFEANLKFRICGINLTQNKGCPARRKRLSLPLTMMAFPYVCL